MNPTTKAPPTSAPHAPKPSQPANETKRNLNIDLAQLGPAAKKIAKKLSKHITFIVLILALLIYVFVVWNIKNLAAVEPSLDAENAALANTKVPKIDQSGINQIQTLEKNSTAIHALFEKARNNPFNE